MNKRAMAAAAVVLSISGLILWRAKDGAAKQTLADPTHETSANHRPKVDIVFALDTTGSMGGLISGAKAKIWEIARKAQEGKPAPEVRVGLVAYRDRNDDYVTKVLDLTGDMDLVYARLSELQAGGGGDTPEHVLKGLHDAVDGVHWSSDAKAVKLVYLVGDAPPHLDYDDGITLDGVLSSAKQKGIRISAIRCGNDTSTLAAWTQIAQRSDGEVSTIEQTGGVVAITTPYDAELARLNAELARTEVHFGSASERKAADAVVAANVAAPKEAQAERAAFFAARSKDGPAKPTKNDLTAASGMAVAAVPTSDLPDEMQKMSAEEREQFVANKRKEREAVLTKIRDVQAKRDAHLKTAAPKPAATAFDTKVYDSLKKAGAKSGISY
jgi:Mg-chelatase subunit ChlD